MNWTKNGDRGFRLTLSMVVMMVIVSSKATGQCIETKLLASDSVANESFGRSVSISGTPGNVVAIIGALNDDDNGIGAGSAYIFRFVEGIWDQEAKLFASDGGISDFFGWSVSISGDPGNEVAIVGAAYNDDNGSSSGSAYIFRFNPETSEWFEEAKLLPSDGSSYDYFGLSVSISGNPGNEVAIVGARRDDDNGESSGSAYIYRKSGANWVEEAKLLASNGAVGDIFGSFVSISGTHGNEIAIVGAPGDDDNGSTSGSAYIYRKSGANWVEEAWLLASDGGASDYFGDSVSISGNPGNEVVIVGSIRDDDNGRDSGSAYIYRFNPRTSGWIEEAKLLGSDGVNGNHFGQSVSISGASGSEVAIVGATGNLYSGSAYLYRFNGSVWEQFQKVHNFDGSPLDHLGISVSISGTLGNEVAIIGAHFDDTNGLDSGAAYVSSNVFVSCQADTDCDAAVGVVDLLTLLGGWGPNPVHPANFNGDGAVNVLDLLIMLGAWGDCP